MKMERSDGNIRHEKPYSNRVRGFLGDDRDVYWKEGHRMSDLKENSLRKRAELYAESVKKNGVQPQKLIGFIDCEKPHGEAGRGHRKSEIVQFRSQKNGHAWVTRLLRHQKVWFYLFMDLNWGGAIILLCWGEVITTKFLKTVKHWWKQSHIYRDNADDVYVLRTWFQVE